MVRRLNEMDSEDQEIHPCEPDLFEEYTSQIEYFIRACDSVKSEAENLLNNINDLYSDNPEYRDYYVSKEKRNAIGKLTIKLLYFRNQIRKLL